MTLDNLALDDDDDGNTGSRNNNKQITKFGSMLFTRCISGTRIVPRGECKTISGHTFQGFGSSHESYNHAYMTAACAVGMCESEMNEFFIRLEKSWKDYCAKREKERKKKAKEQNEAGVMEDEMKDMILEDNLDMRS
jgi:O-phospho-L-seryl-tRNASec:L-selenocysteinyl-tRNA synthase